MPLSSHSDLQDFTKRIFIAAGTEDAIANQIAASFVRANLSGMDSHGVIRIVEYVREIEEGKIHPNALPKVVRETKATASVDGQYGFGHITSMKAMELAVQKANDYGIGVASAFHCNHNGRLADYPVIAVEKNMIGLFISKTYPCNVAPWGGRTRLLSTSPWSYGIPAGEEKPIIADIATSTSAEGKIRIKMLKGEKIPFGWIVDAQGRRTDNPADLYDGGAILPFGEHKGYAINLLSEAMGGALSGGGVSDEFEGRTGVFAQAVNIEFFTPIAEFKANIDKLIRKMHSSQPAEGFKAVQVPGEFEAREFEKRSKSGIQIEEATWEAIVKVAQKYGVEVPSV
ncbi:MAG: Ldh family oxidoreductase [Thaumarchaeota archaeon]|nr:Ldh family oxidoreductase [Nitrososphaerota archaeon]